MLDGRAALCKDRWKYAFVEFFQRALVSTKRLERLSYAIRLLLPRQVLAIHRHVLLRAVATRRREKESVVTPQKPFLTSDALDERDSGAMYELRVIKDGCLSIRIFDLDMIRISIRSLDVEHKAEPLGENCVLKVIRRPNRFRQSLAEV